MRGMKQALLLGGWTLGLAVGLSVVDGRAAEHERRPLPDRAAVVKTLPELHLLEPVWSAEVIHGESFIPLKLEENDPISGRLAFPATELLSVKSADGKRTFKIGEEITLGDDGRTLIMAAAAKVPFLTSKDLYPPADAPAPQPGEAQGYKHRAGHPEQNMLFDNGHWFHDRQVEVSYRRQPGKWPATVPTLAEKSLPRTIARLRAGQPITLGISGDSISEGYNASAFTSAAPGMAPYPDLVAAQLQASAKSDVTLHNRSVGGWSIVNGLQDLDAMLALKPHLLIVAYGMNDVGRRDPAWFKEQTETLIKRAQAADPEIEIILVATMLGNSEWIHTPREMFDKYRDELASLTGPGVALADMTSIWDVLLKHKHDLDLNGNGLNHPNDFGHRLYAQAILALLVE